MPYQHVAVSVTPEELSGLLRAVELACRRGMDERLGRIGMSVSHWHALRLLSGNPGIRQRRLARLADHSSQAFTTLLARMVTYDFIARRGTRRQAATHELTPLGRQMLRMGDEIVGDVLSRLFGTLTESEREALRVLLKRVLQARWRLRLDPLPGPIERIYPGPSAGPYGRTPG